MKQAPKSEEFTRFEDAMRRIVSVPKTEVERRIEAIRAQRSPFSKRGPKPKFSASRASASSPHKD